MPRYKEVKGLAAVTMAEGRKVGSIDELVLDPQQKRVRWLRIRDRDLTRKRRWVPVQAIHALGQHAVTINAEADVRPSAEASEAEELAKTKQIMVDSKAVTESGEYLGKVDDYEFSDETFALTRVFVPTRRFGQTMTIPADQVLTIGRDVTILKTDAANQRSEKANQEPDLGEKDTNSV